MHLDHTAIVRAEPLSEPLLVNVATKSGGIEQGVAKLLIGILARRRVGARCIEGYFCLASFDQLVDCSVLTAKGSPSATELDSRLMIGILINDPFHCLYWIGAAK